jgi:hypothetical protein
LRLASAVIAATVALAFINPILDCFQKAREGNDVVGDAPVGRDDAVVRESRDAGLRVTMTR